MRHRLAVGLVAAIFAFGVAPAPRVHAADTTIVISQGVDLDTLDPIKKTITPSFNVTYQMYDELLAHDQNGKLVPRLATSWKQISPTVWEFKLRHDVKFWNGDPFTSADVAFTVAKIKDPAEKSEQIPRVNTIDHVETPDPYTVRYVTTKPAALIPGRPWATSIVDSKFWKEKGDAYFAEHAMGTGPYMFKSWRKDEELALDVNPNYWGGKPEVDHVVFRPIPENAARVAALKTGTADIITNVPVQYALSIAGGRNTQMVSTRSTRVLFIAFNTMKPGWQQNKLVRQAFNYAVDVPAIIKSVLGGRGYELNGPIPGTPRFVGYDPKVPAYTHDLAKAKALLAQAAYPDGKGLPEIVLNSPAGRYNKDKEVSEAVAGQLSALGVKVTVKTQEWPTYVGLTTQRALLPMYMLGWGNDTYDADDTLTSLLSGEGRLSTFDNPELTKQIHEARFEVDAAKRQKIYDDVLAKMHDEAPWIFLFQYEDLYATSKRVAWQPRPDEYIFAKDIKLR